MKRVQRSMQAMPLWSLEGEIETRPARTATVIPFPGADARARRIVTYPARIGLPARTIQDDCDIPPPAWHATLTLAGIGLLLLVTLLNAN